MTALRDALATALHHCADSGGVIGDFECYCRRIATVDGSRDGPQSDGWGEKEYVPEEWGQVAGQPTGCERDADAILFDPSFRVALTVAVAEAWWHVVYEGHEDGNPPDDEARDDAERMVARMLDSDLPPGWSRPHATGLA